MDNKGTGFCKHQNTLQAGERALKADLWWGLRGTGSGSDGKVVGKWRQCREPPVREIGGRGEGANDFRPKKREKLVFIPHLSFSVDQE